MIHSHPSGTDASDPDRYTAYMYKQQGYNYFAIYDSRKKTVKEYQPFDDFEASIWKTNHDAGR